MTVSTALIVRFGELLAELTEVHAKIMASVPAEKDEGSPADDKGDEFIETWRAAERFGMPMDKVRRWCREGCGKKSGGRRLASVRLFRDRLDLK